MRHALCISLLGTWLTGCGNLDGLGGPTPPLVTFRVRVSGDLGLLRPPGDSSVPALKVALVWGSQWMTEPFCILPAQSAEAAAVIAAGCRDPFGFVPLRVAASAPIIVGALGSVSLYSLPAADVMVGDVTSRVAYGSFLVYEDRDGDGTLGLSNPHRAPGGGRREDNGGDDTPDSADIVYGASFATMTAPDQRVAFREGAFNAKSAFYPRSGCDSPPAHPQFSILSAGGFSVAAGFASAATGVLPAEDPATCAQAPADGAVVDIRLQAPDNVREVSCGEPNSGITGRYLEPPGTAPDLSGRVTACVHVPTFDSGTPSSLIQLVVSSRTGDHCQGLTHYTLRGCRESVSCASPDWDYTATPPTWWPCPQ